MDKDSNAAPVTGWKQALEFGPILAFFVAYLWLKDRTFTIGGTEYDGFIIVTAAFIPLLVAATLVAWRLTGQISAMQIVTVVLVVVFGGLTVWLNDDRFFKMKPTLIYLSFSGALWIGLLRGQSWLQRLMGTMLSMEREGWMILTRRVALLFLALALMNEAVWRGMTTDFWVYFKTFGMPVIMIAFFLAQGNLLQKYGQEDE